MKLHKRFNLIATLVILAALTFSVFSAKTAKAAPPGGTTTTFWVNDPGDKPDNNTGDGVCNTGDPALGGTGRTPCTLRAAIQQANASAGAARVIAFEICPSDFSVYGDVPGSYKIAPASPLPALTDGLTYINGYTQGYGQVTLGYDDPGTNAAACNGVATPRLASPNTANFGQALNTVLAVSIDGATCVSPAPTNGTGGTTAVSGGLVPSGSIIRWGGTGACSGFTVTSNRNVFAGLNIRNWRDAGILVMPMIYTTTETTKPSENTVWGDFIGTNISGTVSLANRFGVSIIGSAHSNYIGDTYAIPSWAVADTTWVEEPTNNERNLISGNDNPHFIYGYSCTEGGGMTNFRDDGAGVFLGVDPCIRQDGSTQTSIFTGGAMDNHVRNSYIGSAFNGTGAVPNSSGVWLNYDAGADTLDGGNTYYPGNHIGGCLNLPFVIGAVGGCSPQADGQQDPNLISGNRRLTGANGANQTLGGHGVWLNGFTSANAQKEGDFDVSYNEIAGNFIGTDATGTQELPNGGDGVYLLANQTVVGTDGPDHNEIGATTEYLPTQFFYKPPYAPLSSAYRYGNVISANGDPIDSDSTLGRWDNGIEMRGTGAEYNRVAYGNVIGLNSQGTNLPVDVGNGENGVFIWFGAQYNMVHNNSASNITDPYYAAGGDLGSHFGAISENGDFDGAQGRSGIRVSNQAQFNYIFRNCIGGDAINCGGTTYGNHTSGIYIDGAAVHTWVGLFYFGPNPGDVDNPQPNWIHHNGKSGVGDGVTIVDANTLGNVIRFNNIWRNGDPGGVPGPGNLGIDLKNDDDTPNDAGDVDTGPNNVQNYPDNRTRAGDWLISFTEPANCTNATCWTDIYATEVSQSDWVDPFAAADPQDVNNGEGRYWLTRVNGNATNLDISAAVYAVLGNPPATNICISLTTTRQQGTGGSPSTPYRNTSEFSPCLGFYPTAVTLNNLSAHANGTLPALALAGLALLAISAAGLFTWRRRVSAR